MRFHRLTLTAFGPYADTQSIDFDELNEAGVFLLTGPTGAGKTSILDAVCFALYGVVPGVRDVKTLRSHHAADGTAPEVELEVTIGERRLRVRRSPEWQRPKKRGEGTTREHACATLCALEDDGSERMLSSRVAEIGHELTTAIGMSSEQFMQVVLLPQGDFQRFLQATSDERQSVLQKLFRTQRFARIEDWMRERTRDLGARAAEAEQAVCQLLGTIANRAGTEVPDPLQARPLGLVGDEARSWAGTALAVADAEHETAAKAEATALARLEAAQDAERAAVAAIDAVRRRSAAQCVLTELEATESQAKAEAVALRRHRAALQVRPLLTPVTGLRRQLTDARARRLVTAAAVEDLSKGPFPTICPPTTDRAACAAAHRELVDRLATLRAVEPREVALIEGRASLEAAKDALAQHLEELETCERLVAALPDEHERARRALDESRLLAHGLPEARAALGRAEAQHHAVLGLPSARDAHDELVLASLVARERAAGARERHLTVLEQRLAGMAAELAGQLVEGEPCQVCGGVDHPVPAQARPDAVTEEDQHAAEREAEQLRAAADAVADQLSTAARELQALETAAAGLDLAGSTEAVTARRDAVAAAEAATAATELLETRLAAHEEEERALDARLQQVRSDLAATRVRASSLETSCEELAREVRTAVGPEGGSVAESIARAELTSSVLQDAVEAWEALALADQRVTEAVSLADDEAVRHDFASAVEAETALLPAPEADCLEARAQEREQARRSAAATLADVPEVDDVPDLVQVRSASADAVEAWRLRTAELSTAAERRTALASLVAQLDDAVTAWEPVREEHSTAESMSRLVRGMGAENQLQMRLSSYVLATRLDQVLDAANERLAQMRDQRYSLRRCGRTRGGARSGLGLEVLDTWTGEARAPSTLSGGETFVVSLALALGLADVVTQEAGGTRVDTLFVDEGFGMLDPETLDDVMDRIDALRAGGRTVGVVSHVTELRSRIPTQVHVERGRAGSSVSVRTLVA